MTPEETGSTIPIGFVPNSREDWIRLANAENRDEILATFTNEQRREFAK